MTHCKGLFYCHVVFSCGTILRHHRSTDMLFCKRRISNVYGHKSLFATFAFGFDLFRIAQLQSHISLRQVSYGAELPHPPRKPRPVRRDYAKFLLVWQRPVKPFQLTESLYRGLVRKYQRRSLTFDLLQVDCIILLHIPYKNNLIPVLLLP